jgi:hypothetical protein
MKTGSGACGVVPCSAHWSRFPNALFSRRRIIFQTFLEASTGRLPENIFPLQAVEILVYGAFDNIDPR